MLNGAKITHQALIGMILDETVISKASVGLLSKKLLKQVFVGVKDLVLEGDPESVVHTVASHQQTPNMFAYRT